MPEMKKKALSRPDEGIYIYGAAEVHALERWNLYQPEADCRKRPKGEEGPSLLPDGPKHGGGRTRAWPQCPRGLYALGMGITLRTPF